MFRAAPEGPRGWSEESRGSGDGSGRTAGRIWGSTSEVPGRTLGRDGGSLQGFWGSSVVHRAGVQGSTRTGPGKTVGEAPRAGGGAPKGALAGLRGTRGGSTCGDTVDMGVASTVGVARNLGTGKLGQLWSVGAGGHGHEETWGFGGTLALLGHKAPGEWHLLWPGCPRRPNTNRLWRGWGSLGTGGTLAPGWL